MKNLNSMTSVRQLNIDAQFNRLKIEFPAFSFWFFQFYLILHKLH